MAIAVSAAVALRLVPQFAPVVGDWADLSRTRPLIEGDQPPDNSMLLGAGLSYHPNASDEVFVRYDGAWAEDDIHGSALSAAARSAGSGRSARCWAGRASFKTQVNPGRGVGRGWHLPER
jgi:hypothetical protein